MRFDFQGQEMPALQRLLTVNALRNRAVKNNLLFNSAADASCSIRGGARIIAEQ
jgi:hypothetical protein